MVNVIEILKSMGVTLTSEQETELNKQVSANYKTIAEFDKKVGNLEKERDEAKTQLTTAQETLKGFEGVDVETMNKKLEEYRKKAEDAEKEFKEKLAKRDFEDALKVAMDGYKFSSEAAKKSIMEEVRAKDFRMEGDRILGLNDFMDTVKERDKDAFAPTEEGGNPAKFTGKMNNGGGGKSYSSKAEIMEIKDPVERQNAIRDNLNLFTQKG